MRAVCLLIVFYLFVALPAVAQSQQKIASLRQDRFKKVDYYHVGVGIETGLNENWYIGPRLFVGIGSYRNFLNADVGIGYQFYNLLGSSEKERMMLYQLPLFANMRLNVARWSSGCVYMGGEAVYSLAVRGLNAVPHADVAEVDNQLGRNHAMAASMLGVRLNHWDFSLQYVYDLSPAFNQKYVFESSNYDYDSLHASLFERGRFVLNISYLIPL